MLVTAFAVMPVWLSREVLPETKLLIPLMMLLMEAVVAGGAVAGGVTIEPLPLVLIIPIQSTLM